MKELTGQQQRMIAEALRSGTAQQWQHTQGHQYFIEELSSDTPEGLRIAKCIKLATLLWHSTVGSRLEVMAPGMSMSLEVVGLFEHSPCIRINENVDTDYDYESINNMVIELCKIFFTYPTIVAVWMNAAKDEPQDGE